MQVRRFFINQISYDFLEVGIHDLEELRFSGPRSESCVALELDALCALQFFPKIRHLILRPGALCPEDLEYLRDCPIISLKLDYYSDAEDEYTIDLGLFPCLEFLFCRSRHCFSNAQGCRALRTLVVQEWADKDLRQIGGSGILALSIFSGKLKTLDGIEEIPGLTSLVLSNQRTLRDIRALATASGLESLRLENCNAMAISQLPKLPNLRYLGLAGKQTVDNLTILKRFSRLERVLLDINILDGDLEPLKTYQHSVVLTDRAHYSAKNSDLPKSREKFHSEDIPNWLEVI